MTNNGFVFLWRKIKETSFYRNSITVHLALHLLMEANHEDKKFIFNNEEVMIKRGQCIVGRKSLSEETGIAEGTVYDKLKILEKVNFCNIKSNNRFSIITIINYEAYQNIKQVKQHQKQQPANNQPTTSQQPANTNNNNNTLNNEKKTICMELFDFFCLKTKKNLKATPERLALIDKRLKDGFTPEQMRLAIENFCLDDWAERDKFFDLIYCIGIHRKIDNLDKWLNYKPKQLPPSKPKEPLKPHTKQEIKEFYNPQGIKKVSEIVKSVATKKSIG